MTLNQPPSSAVANRCSHRASRSRRQRAAKRYRRRHRFERLEQRTLLAVMLGIAGDSLSDEYLHETHDYASNWAELLAEQTSIDLGAQNNRIIGDADDRGEPRREGGYEFNWARYGATSSSLLTAGQHTGLADQISNQQVSHAVLAVGQHDFNPVATSVYSNIYFGTWTEAQIDDYVSSVVTNIETALDTISTGDAKVVLSNIVDIGVTPLVKLFFSNSTGRARVATVIGDVNDQLLDLAQARNIPLVDMFGVANDLLGNPAVTVGGVEFSNTSGRGVTNLFVGDGVHPHTVSSAVIANVYLTAFDLGYSAGIDRFSEQEIVEIVGLDYAQDSLNFDYASYVTVPQHRFQNRAQPLDVNRDLKVSSLDALQVLNFVRQYGRDFVLPENNTMGNYPDVTGNDKVTVLDALRILNVLGQERPILSARLVNDTAPDGQQDLDFVTAQYDLEFGVTGGDDTQQLEIRVDAQANDPFTNAGDLPSDAPLLLTESQLDAIAGTALDDGDHWFEIRLAGDLQIQAFMVTIVR